MSSIVPAFMPYEPVSGILLANLFLIALAVHDLRERGRVHPATVWGSLPLLLLQWISFTPFYASATATAVTSWLAHMSF